MLGLNTDFDNRKYDQDVIVMLESGKYVNLQPRMHITKGKVTPFNSAPVDKIVPAATQEEFKQVLEFTKGWAKRIGTLSSKWEERKSADYKKAVADYEKAVGKNRNTTQEVKS